MADAFPIPTHKKFKDLRGQVFVRWTVLSYAGMHRTQGAQWKCRCECGTVRLVFGRFLAGGRTKSCGCLSHEMTSERNRVHGYAVRGNKTPEYIAWENMKKRCNCPTDPRYKWYGARGIAVFPLWDESFEAFLADVGLRPSPDHTIDRIDNDRGYEPGNVRWTTWKVQQNNRRPRNTVVRDRRLRRD